MIPCVIQCLNALVLRCFDAAKLQSFDAFSHRWSWMNAQVLHETRNTSHWLKRYDSFSLRELLQATIICAVQRSVRLGNDERTYCCTHGTYLFDNQHRITTRACNSIKQPELSNRSWRANHIYTRSNCSGIPFRTCPTYVLDV
jgi:hypothetical protein